MLLAVMEGVAPILRVLLAVSVIEAVRLMLMVGEDDTVAVLLGLAVMLRVLDAVREAVRL